MRKVICSGTHRLDIDAYACMIGLFELESLRGNDVHIYLPANFSSTITKEIASRPHTCQTIDEILPTDKLILVDVSDRHYLAEQCGYDLDRVIQIVDHHFGSEGYRQKKIGDASVIEPIGAAATLVFEKAQEANLIEKLSDTAMKLLYIAILSNTLDFNSLLTCERDITAHNILLLHLQNRGLFSHDRKSRYFGDIDAQILQNTEASITLDMKEKVVVDSTTYAIGQLELWSSRNFMLQKKDLITTLLTAYENPNWFFTCPSISEGKTYLLVENELLQKKLGNIFHLYPVEKSLYQVDRLVLRKEWIKGLFGQMKG